MEDRRQKFQFSSVLCKMSEGERRKMKWKNKKKDRRKKSSKLLNEKKLNSISDYWAVGKDKKARVRKNKYVMN